MSSFFVSSKRGAAFVATSVVASVGLAVIAPAPAQAGIHISFFGGKKVEGSGRVVEIVRPVAAFNRIEASDGIRVVLTQSAQQKLSIKTDDNIEPLIESRVDGGTLKLRTTPNTRIRTNNGITLSVDFVTLDALTVRDGARAEAGVIKALSLRISARDGADINVKDVTASELDVAVKDGASAVLGTVRAASRQSYVVADGASLTLDKSSGDRMTMKVVDGASMTVRAVDTKSLDARIADGARADVAGFAQTQTINVTDGASLDTQGLRGASAQVHASDGATLKMGAVQTLDAEVQDGGSVRYAGEPTITHRLRDGASLKKI